MKLNEYFTPQIAKEKRIHRIEYAINNFHKEGIDFEHQKRNMVYKDEDITLYMGKPGKDNNKNGKKDLTPIVKYNKENELSYEERRTFEHIWANIYQLDKQLEEKNETETMKIIYLLIYRLAYMVDFEIDKKWGTYFPNEEYKNKVKEVQKIINKCNIKFNLKEYIGFLDLLGWNEDYKYQYKMNFDYPNTGRLNCILCMISVPLALKNLKIKKGKISNIDNLIKMCYNFSISRGIYVLKKDDLIKELGLEEK